MKNFVLFGFFAVVLVVLATALLYGTIICFLYRDLVFGLFFSLAFPIVFYLLALLFEVYKKHAL